MSSNFSQGPPTTVPMLGAARYLQNGSDFSRSVCKRFHNQSMTGTCIGTLTADGGQQLSLMRGLTAKGWGQALGSCKDVSVGTLKNHEVLQSSQNHYMDQFRKTAFAIHHGAAYAASLGSAARATDLLKWNDDHQKMYSDVETTARRGNPDEEFTLINQINALAAHGATLGTIYSTSATLPLASQRATLAPEQPPRLRTSFGPSSSGPSSMVSTPVSVLANPRERTIRYGNTLAAELKDSGGPLGTARTRRSDDISKSMFKTLQRASITRDARIEYLVQEVSKRRALQAEQDEQEEAERSSSEEEEEEEEEETGAGDEDQGVESGNDD